MSNGTKDYFRFDKDTTGVSSYSRNRALVRNASNRKQSMMFYFVTNISILALVALWFEFFPVCVLNGYGTELAELECESQSKVRRNITTWCVEPNWHSPLLIYMQ